MNIKKLGMIALSIASFSVLPGCMGEPSYEDDTEEELSLDDTDDGSAEAATAGENNAFTNAINVVRRSNGKSNVAANMASANEASRLNDMCGFSHSCATSAEIIYKESGYGASGRVQRAVNGWVRSPGHFNIMIGSYTKVGCAGKVSGSEWIARCRFTR